MGIMRTIKWWVEPNKNMYGVSPKEQRTLIYEALMEIEWVCNVKFLEVDKRYKSHIAMTFKPQSQMPQGALGYMKSGGLMLLNTTRKVSKRNIISVIVHEICAHYFGLGHHPDRHCINHAFLGAFMCSDTAIRLQNKLGRPKNPFYTRDRRDLDDKMRPKIREFNQLQEDFFYLKSIFEDILTPSDKHEYYHSKVKPVWEKYYKAWKDLTEDTKKWHKLRVEWQKVPMSL